MLTLIGAGAYCPLDDLAAAFEAAGWRLAAPDAPMEDAASAAQPTLSIHADGLDRLAESLAQAPSARAVILHVSREEAVARALCEGGEAETALDRWRASASEQIALFRRMRPRVILAPRRRLETAPAAVLGGEATPQSVGAWRVDPLALALATLVVAALPDPDGTASMLAACVREEDRAGPALDVEDALAAWRDGGAPTAEVENLRKIDADRAEEITLLREQLAHLQTAFEAAWLQNEEMRASVSRQPRAHQGLTRSVDLGAAP
jgi:hypothetical protein